MGKFLELIDILVHRHRAYIYIGSILIAAVSVYGIFQLKSVSYMVDDVPEESQVKKDLKFFEANFSGIMPLEMVVEFKTKRRRPIMEVKNLRMVDEFESFLDSITVMSRPVSLLSFVKASKQAFYNNNPERYSLPNQNERGFILTYMKNSDLLKAPKDSVKKDSNTIRRDSLARSNSKGLLTSFVDST